MATRGVRGRRAYHRRTRHLCARTTAADRALVLAVAAFSACSPPAMALERMWVWTRDPSQWMTAPRRPCRLASSPVCRERRRRVPAQPRTAAEMTDQEIGDAIERDAARRPGTRPAPPPSLAGVNSGER